MSGTTFWYLASPYSRYPGGIEEAFRLALRETGRLVSAGVPVFSPIAHTHPVAVECGLDPYSHDIWIPVDEPIMRAASGLIMLRAESWEQSYGMRLELEAFTAAGKPVVWMDVGTVPAELRRAP
ncbi:conserved protein of unknown function (plasmid) [Rhodovastum atsumiense]|uniref:DUF1937 family protein n=1 Tax=Rhodovastum atsumiense TaxID=504468 RepID=UPI00139F2A7C|nr:DUF1937 family protein [Rhodovastum atsumiense]CAH2606094.1 conserved protein of unknown function [Rhodovastum atsumiense]